jgi:hypothetical protein
VPLSHIRESGIGTLQHLCQVAHNAALPPIWTRLAQLGIKHSRRVLEAAAQEPPGDRTFSFPVVGRPVISPELSQSVTSLHFCRVRDDMEGCLSMFAVSYPDQASVAAANERNGLYDQQTSGAALPSWGDLLDSKKSRALQLPVDWFQLRLVFLAFHRFLQILLGEQHVIPLGILNLFTVMEDLAASDLYKAMDGAKQCTELMAAVDVYTWSWADQQERSPTPVAPEYGLLAQELRLRKWKPPDLPATLLAVLKPLPATAGGGPCHGAAPAPAPAAAGPAAINPAREPGVFNGSVSVNKLVQVATPSKILGNQVPCL